MIVCGSQSARVTAAKWAAWAGVVSSRSTSFARLSADCVGQERPGLGHPGDAADQVEVDPADELGVVGRGGRGDPAGRPVGGEVAVDARRSAAGPARPCRPSSGSVGDRGRDGQDERRHPTTQRTGDRMSHLVVARCASPTE